MRFPMSFRRRLRVRIRRGNLELVLLISFALRPTRRFPRVPSPRPNDSLAPARSALAGLRLRPNSFRRFPGGSSPPLRGGDGDEVACSCLGPIYTLKTPSSSPTPPLLAGLRASETNPSCP